MTATAPRAARRPRWRHVALTVLLVGFISSCTGDDDETQESPESTDVDNESGDGEAPGSTEEGDGTTTPTRPPLNALEEQIEAAMAALGLEAQRAELPGPDSASMYVWRTDGLELPVTAAAEGAHRGSPAVVDEWSADGVEIRIVEYPTAPGRRDQFDCDGVIYEVHAGVPEGLTDRQAFIVAFVDALGCT